MTAIAIAALAVALLLGELTAQARAHKALRAALLHGRIE